MTNTLAQTDAWTTVPLCRHYFSAHVEDLLVEMQVVGGGSADLAVRWAVGVLADGDWEVLGAWSGATAGPAFWHSVWEDLDDRGVEKVSWVCTAERDARALCPTAEVLPPFRMILGQRCMPAASRISDICVEARHAVCEASSVRCARVALEHLLSRIGNGEPVVLAPDWPVVLSQFGSFYALRPQRRAVVRKGDEVLEHLSRILSRAVVRHGPFADPNAATSFVASTLARAEQRLTFSELTGQAPPLRAARPVGASVAVPGP
nr:transposase [uncultured Roseateles sp.]